MPIPSICKMSDETDDTLNFEAVSEPAEKDPEKSPTPDAAINEKASEVNSPPENPLLEDTSPKGSNDKFGQASDKVSESGKKSEETSEPKKKLSYDFANDTERIQSSPSNLNDIYSDEALNFGVSVKEDTPLTKDEKDNKSEIQDKSEKSPVVDKKEEAVSSSPEKKNEEINKPDSDSKESPVEDKKEEKDTGDEKKEEEEFLKRERRKSSILSEADLSRKSSGDPYPIEIPLKKKVNRSTRKKLWREIQRRKPFITDNVYTHIQHFAKPPFKTWGCHNCNLKKQPKSHSYLWNL